MSMACKDDTSLPSTLDPSPVVHGSGRCMSGLLAQRQAFAKRMLHQVFESLLGFLHFLPEHCIPHIYIPLKETGVDMSMYHIYIYTCPRYCSNKHCKGA